MIIFGKEIWKGEMVSAEAFLPQSNVGLIGVLAISALSLAVANSEPVAYLNLNAWNKVFTIWLPMLSVAWCFQRHYSRGSRGGFFLDKPRRVRKPKAKVNFNQALTDHFQKIAGFENCMVTQKRSAQHDVYIIPNLNPRKVEDEMIKISMLLNISHKEMLFEQNWTQGNSAILVPTTDDQWTDVSFDASELDPDKLQMYFGKSVRGNPFIVDLEDDPYGLAAGMTGSGKTNMIRNGLQSLRLSSNKPVIYIIDLKGDAQLMREPCDGYIKTQEGAVNLLEKLYIEGEERQAKYSASDCANLFEYQRKVDSSERGIFILLDEMADFYEEDLIEDLEKGEHPIHKRAKSIVRRFIRKRRGSGIFMLCSMQDPRATIMPKNDRDQMTYRISLMVSDSTASKVALGRTGAEKLQPKGGMLFKKMALKTPQIGRAALLD